ncbi:competence protein ComK [Halolactibacillus halophilus]|uniref:competence protein ComK n=1 Tax=Halolactibacillus halophilus TaxID=306540 RepID=UPI000B7E5A0A|nr:competence protein ComK [Halolactibacillus halophilus]
MHINTLPHYLISHKTLYLEQSFDPRSETIIEETHASYTCLQPMTTILEQTCLSFGSTVAGRKKSMQKIFNLNQTPIFPISPHHDLYCFQTHSPRMDHCVFIMTTHLTHYTACADGITFHFNSGRAKHVQMTNTRVEKIMALLSLYQLYFKNTHPIKRTLYV